MMISRSLFRISAQHKLSVFLFHKVPNVPDQLRPNEMDIQRFQRVMDFLKCNFCVLPLSEAIEKLKSSRLPPGCAAITFDDGYPEWRQGVIPVLEAMSLPATFFITTNQFLGHPMWHERLANVVKHCSKPMLDTTAFRLPPVAMQNLEQRIAALYTLDFHFKYLPPAIQNMFLDQLEAQVGVSKKEVATMSQSDLKDISHRGFEIGAHTHDHPILSLCGTKKARDEIGRSREILESIIQARVKSFAYPNGRPGIDFSYKHIQMIQDAGYGYAVTTQWGTATSLTSQYQIPRFTPWGPSKLKMTLQLFRNQLTQPESIEEIATHPGGTIPLHTSQKTCYKSTP
jgi:peptidoglycan/xylan/chitin deacetylase (PgdA/CDA1 family)